MVSYNRTDGNLDLLWSLSAAGDWNSTTTEGIVQNRTHGSSHEILTANASAVSHDTKGNITLIPASVRSSSINLSLTWDFDNRVNTVDKDDDGTADIIYRYDALGRRVFRDDGTTATVFVLSGQQIIADYAAGADPVSPTYHYVYARYIDEPVYREDVSGTDDIYFHRNEQYSVTAITDTSGIPLEKYFYSPYGVTTILDSQGTVRIASSHNNELRHTGRRQDQATGLYYYRSRCFAPELGRFCSRDPMGFFDGPNLFEFLKSRPFNFIDPFGLSVEKPGPEVLAACEKILAESPLYKTYLGRDCRGWNPLKIKCKACRPYKGHPDPSDADAYPGAYFGCERANEKAKWNPQIHICTNHLVGKSEGQRKKFINAVLGHELVHWMDACQGCGCEPWDLFWPETKSSAHHCAPRVCSEIRAFIHFGDGHNTYDDLDYLREHIWNHYVQNAYRIECKNMTRAQYDKLFDACSYKKMDPMPWPPDFPDISKILN